MMVDPSRPRYEQVVSDVAGMVGDPEAREMVGARGLDLLNLTWEDTGRWEGSSVGPNISDVTIEVERKDRRGKTRTALMPVLRHPNFTDKTGDVPIDDIVLPILLYPAVWTALFFYACFERRIGRGYAIVGGLTALHAIVYALRLGEVPP